MENKTLFRFHRGSFADSMATAVEVDGFDHLKELITEDYKCIADVEEIIIEPYDGIDDRNGWDTHIVLVKLKGYDKAHPVGWTNKMLTKQIAGVPNVSCLPADPATKKKVDDLLNAADKHRERLANSRDMHDWLFRFP